jgi:hypothetical protein
MPKNPSELARIEDELRYWKNNLKHHVGSKSTKEYILRQIRQCEAQLGIEGKDYNSNEFFSN